MKYFLYSLFTVVLSVVLSSCNTPSSKDERVISVSIEPQKYFLESIVGNKYEINTAIPSGANPESYDPSPSQMVNIGKSILYFKIGNMGFENTWLNNIHSNNPNMKIIDCSVGIPHIHDGGHHGDCDPHTWSTPKTASTICKNMYNAIIEMDAQNRDYYLENYTALEKNIQRTDSIIKSYLDNAPTKSFVIYHPALSYFANQYNLKQYSIEVEGKSPSPQQLSQLIKQAKQDSVKVVFLQEEFDTKNAETIAQELGAKIVRINLLTYDWNDEMVKIAKAIANKYDE